MNFYQEYSELNWHWHARCTDDKTKHQFLQRIQQLKQELTSLVVLQHLQRQHVSQKSTIHIFLL